MPGGASGAPTGLSGKSPQEAARIVGQVDRRNYFAHTIREMQRTILRAHGLHYHINTHMDERVKETCIAFHELGCDIYMAGECEGIDERAVRLTLAHELGHLVLKIDGLRGLVGRVPLASPDDEVYAWEFAYHLVMTKSDLHERDIERKKHIFRPDELKTFMAPILSRTAPDVRRRVAEALGLPL